MLLATELINDNGISGVAAALFTALIGGMATAIVGIFQVKAKAIEAKARAIEAKEEAEQARLNTTNISNGFASNVDTKLDRIIEKQDKLDDALRNHLEWHLRKDT